MRIAPKNRSDQAAVSATNVNQRVDAGKIIAGMERFVGLGRHSAHGIVKNFGVVRMLRKVLPNIHSERVIEGNPAGAHAVH